MSILERITKLVALTDNPNENEARNAAAKACALIRKHGLQVAPAKSDDPLGVLRAFSEVFPYLEKERLERQVKSLRAIADDAVRENDRLRDANDHLRQEVHAARVREYERVNVEERGREAAE
jgi:hypothetical protein